MGPTAEILIMGIGNEMRSDDRVGLVLARSLRDLRLSGVRVAECGGDITAWLRYWSEAQRVVLLDAVVTGAPAGTLHVRDLTMNSAAAPRSASTHGLGLGHIIELARGMGRLPQRLLVVGIEGKDFGYGTTLSPPVAAALPSAAKAVRQIVGMLQAETSCQSLLSPGNETAYNCRLAAAD